MKVVIEDLYIKYTVNCKAMQSKARVELKFQHNIHDNKHFHCILLLQQHRQVVVISIIVRGLKPKINQLNVSFINQKLHNWVSVMENLMKFKVKYVSRN